MKEERSQIEEKSESVALSTKSPNVEQTVHQTMANVVLKMSPGCSRGLHAEHPGLLFKK